MKTINAIAAVVLPSAVILSSLPLQAQLPGSDLRQARRDARQVQRQVNRYDYFPQQTWQQLNPWLKEYGVTPAERAANAVRQSVDAATRLGDGRYGFRDQAAVDADPWFYDYYTYTPTYYGTLSDDRYSSAIRYFDRDGDGIYESRLRYSDSDADGEFDQYDRYDFYSYETPTIQPDTDDSVQADPLSGVYEGPRYARRQQVTGEIVQMKRVNVNDSENLLVAVKDNGRLQPIDLGPAAALESVNPQIGTPIAATGVMEVVGEKPVLIADTVKVDTAQEMEIVRGFGQQLEGTIIAVESTPIDSQDHYLAVVDVDGNRRLIDLGPTAKYDVEIRPETRITVAGVPVQSGDYRVTIANRVGFDGRTIVIDQR